MNEITLNELGVEDPNMIFTLNDNESFNTDKGYKIIGRGLANLDDGENFITVVFDAVNGNDSESWYGVEMTWRKIWSELAEGCGYTDEEWELMN